MLALVKRTGTEFGIAVVVASHLLGEIERVCDHLVAVDAGRLIRSAPLTDVHRADRHAGRRRRGGRRRAWPMRSVAAGLQAVADGRTVLVELVDDRPWDLVRDAVADLGLPLVRMEQRRRGLEELFQ